MVVPAARSHRRALEKTQSRRRLARVEQRDRGKRCQRVDVLAGDGRDAREPLQKIERGSLRRKDRRQRSNDSCHLVAGPQLRAVGLERDVLARWVDLLENARGSVASAQDSSLL